MSKVLYATGLLQGDTQSLEQTLSQGISVKVVQSIAEFIDELEENSSEYSYCLLCIKSFYNTGNRTEEALFSDLQMIVAQNKHIAFCFIDQDKQLSAKFNLSLAPLNNIKYTSATKITLRTFNTLLFQFLQGKLNAKVEQKPISIQQAPPVKPKAVTTPPPAKPAPVVTPPPQKSVEAVSVAPQASDKQLNDLDEAIIKQSQKTVATDWDAPAAPVAPQTPVSKPEPKKSFSLFGKKKVEQVPSNEPAPATQKSPEIKPLVPDRRKQNISKSPLHALKGKSLLFTQVSSCGATTVAIMTARLLAKSGMTVCYVEVNENFASSNTILDADLVKLTGVNDSNNLDSFISDTTDDILDCFEMCEDIHILRNNPTQILRERDIMVLGKKLPRMFDVVVYDVNMNMLRECPLFLLTCSYKYLVMTNDYSDVMKVAIELTRQCKKYYNIPFIDTLGESICREFKLVISRYATLDGKSRRRVIWQDVQEEVVDANEELCDFELLDVAAIVPECISISNDLFSKDSLRHIAPLLEGLI